jgi:hypothetical protein
VWSSSLRSVSACDVPFPQLQEHQREREPGELRAADGQIFRHITQAGERSRVVFDLVDRVLDLGEELITEPRARA